MTESWRAVVGTAKEIPVSPKVVPGDPAYVKGIAAAKRAFRDSTFVPPNPDPVKRPPHYRMGDIEVIDFIDQTVDGYQDGRLAHYVACALKYLARAPHKGALQQDLAKCEWYVRRAVNRAAEVSAQAQK
jgi:hypothetical protein